MAQMLRKYHFNSSWILQTEKYEGKFVISLQMTYLIQTLTHLVGLVSAKTYIFGGEIAIPNSEPHIISLQKSSTHFCGATLVSATHGISAAHCYNRKIDNQFLVLPVSDLDYQNEVLTLWRQ